MGIPSLLRPGLIPATAILVAGIVLVALFLDWLIHALLMQPLPEMWVLIDIVIASAIATPITFTLLRLLQRAHLQRIELAETNRTLSGALAEVRELKGLLPVCASCKKLRDDDGYWQQVDVYIRKHTRAEITHSLCPACMAEHYPQFLGD